MNTTQTPPAAPNNDLDFAPLAGLGQSKLATTPKSITPFAGLASFLAWLRQMGCYERLAQAMPFSYTSPTAIPLADTLCAFLVSVILGAARFAHCDWLRFDSALHAMCSASCASRAMTPFCASSGASPGAHRGVLPAFEPVARESDHAARRRLQPGSRQHHFQSRGPAGRCRQGLQPKASGTQESHPLLAALAEAPFILHAWLRSGNTEAGRGVIAFLQETLAQLPVGWRLRTVRADSGFFDQALLAYLEECGLPYLIVARLTRQIKARLHSAAMVWRELDQGYAVGSFTAKLQGWQDTRRFIVVRETVREDKEAVGRRLLDVPGYTFRIWVTHRNEDPATLWRDYH